MKEKELEIILKAESEVDLDDALNLIINAKNEIDEFIDKVELALEEEGIEKHSEEVSEILGHLEEAAKWLDDGSTNTDGMIYRIYEISREMDKAAK